MNSRNPFSTPALSRRAFRGSSLAALFLSLGALSAGCGASDDASAETASGLGMAQQAVTGLPATCQQLKSASSIQADGEYTLYVNGDSALAWQAYCYNMAGTPTEFLTLAETGPASNFSQYTAGGAVSGSTVRTYYRKLRIDPVSLSVDTSDQTFTSSSGQLVHGGQSVTSMPFGAAMSCDATASGQANVDLRGTPFAVASNAFAVGGSGGSGTSTYGAGNQTVGLTGGGFCGWNSLPGLFNPFNHSGGLLQLQHTHCAEAGPRLVVNGSTELALECIAGSTYSDAGAQAFDGCGNSIPVHAFNTGTDSSGPGPNPGAEGTYSVSYVAWDSAGRTVSAIRTVTVNDTLAPTLALQGDAHMTHTCGSQWVDPGVTATDACYGEVAPQVQTTGSVNGWVAGTYTVTYSLTDSGGNSAPSVTRTVDVVNCPW